MIITHDIMHIPCRFYSEGANVNNNHRAAGYTIELRDTGRYGFLLPPDKVDFDYIPIVIVPTFILTMVMIKKITFIQ